MHALGLIEEVRRLALAEIARQGGGRLRQLTLRVGTLAGVDPEALRFAWEVVRQEEPTEGADLLIEAVPATALCGPCGRAFPCPDGLAPCPLCGAYSADLRGGRELELASLAFDPTDESSAVPGQGA